MQSLFFNKGVESPANKWLERGSTEVPVASALIRRFSFVKSSKSFGMDFAYSLLVKNLWIGECYE
tara:strand:+ start:3316 stop:3510 length:195 start_codon:yes stop_codon:yes gene_type:complete